MSTAPPGLHVFLVAGEESGDRLGAALMAALRERSPGIRFSGVGGERMAAEGLVRAVATNPPAIVGIVAVLARIFELLRLIRRTAEAAVAANPDILVIIDSPEFTHRVAKHVRRMAPAIPIVDYGAPSVWAWRPWRARAMRGYVDHVMALLPFEPAEFERLGGPPCSYVGHPLIERADRLRPDAAERARRETQPYVVLVMPGSRRGEIGRMLDVFEKTVAQITVSNPRVEFAMPVVPALAAHLERTVAKWRVPVRIVVDQAEKDAVFRVARAALVKSGTGTLELAVSGVPMAAAYRVGHVEGAIAGLFIKVSTVILANLVIGENVVPQFLQYNATPRKLASAVSELIADGPLRDRQIEAFKRLDSIMEIGGARPSDRAAEIVLKTAAERVDA